jgi:hypothetical protein
MPRPPRFRFSLLGMMLVVTLLAIPLTLAGKYVRQWYADRQRLEAIRQIESEKRGAVTFRSHSGNMVSPAPRDDFSRSRLPVGRIYLASCQLDPKSLAAVSILGEARFLSFNSSPFTDQDVPFLDGLWNLGTLQLNGTQITDSGVLGLVGKHRLEQLSLNDTAITDDSVEALATMTTLRQLLIRKTKISSEAIRRLKNKLPDCEIVH